MTTNSAFDTSDTVALKGKVTGVTRVSKKMKMLLALGAFALLGFLIFAIFSMDGAPDQSAAQAAKAEEEAKSRPDAIEPAKPDVITKNQGDGSALTSAGSVTPLFPVGGANPAAPAAASGAASSAPIVLPGSAQGGKPAAAVGPQPDVIVPSASGMTAQPAKPPPTPAELAAQRLAEQRETQRLQAVSGPIEAAGSGAWGQGGAPGGAAAGSQFLAGAQGGAGGMPGNGNAFAAPRPQEPDDQNKQLRKEAFLKEAEGKAGQYYLKESKQSPLGKYELKMGWKIPAMLIDGINSDLPGQTCAQVRENVFDSATGKYLLIPQGTKVCGTYDSQVAVGQVRILMVWNRLMFEDGSSISLQGMPGTDQAGYAGFDAEVDNHYVKVFTGASMLALISAGVQLSQPRQAATATGTAAPTIGQTAAGALGQQLGQVGVGFIQQQMKVQPTLKQAPGYRFNIQLTRDIIFPAPYRS